MAKNKSKILLKLLIGFVFIVGVGLYFNSVLKNWDIEQNLGSNYILCADGEIIYQSSDEKSVEYVIPFGTTRYGFDERWIVVETKTRAGFHQTFPQDTSNHSIFRLDTHRNLTYLCAVTFKNNDYGKRKSKLPGGV